MVIKQYTDKELHKLILAKARAIHSLPKEHAYTIECDGSLYTCPVGSDGFVDVPDDKARSAVIVLHNHPNDVKEPSSFSGKDVFCLLYYRLNELIVCSYGMYFVMKNLGCRHLSTDVMHTLEKKYHNLDKILFKQYVQKSDNSPKVIKANYKLYKRRVEQEYRLFLAKYARENNLLYSEGEL